MKCYCHNEDVDEMIINNNKCSVTGEELSLKQCYEDGSLFDRKNKYVAGDIVRLIADDREYVVYSSYDDEHISLCLYDYPDTEQDNLTHIDEVEFIGKLSLCELRTDSCDQQHQPCVYCTREKVADGSYDNGDDYDE